MSEESLIEFPCQFAIKVMGKNSTEFEALVISIVRQHVSDLGEGAVKNRPSSKGKFTSLTVTVNATSQQHLDDIYRALTASKQVLMAL
ncbi:MAG: DUF493 domain-containing protein [Gammaproteobacteria bacterium]|nr:DUF493 domain-containing protein [Gammaproteobacteria bacterium]MDQ7074712.1 DUF493 domain-containing protein [Gammaproteobacteria bacterium]